MNILFCHAMRPRSMLVQHRKIMCTQVRKTNKQMSSLILDCYLIPWPTTPYLSLRLGARFHIPYLAIPRGKAYFMQGSLSHYIPYAVFAPDCVCDPDCNA